MLAAGINLNANNGPPVDRVRAEGVARGQPVNRRRNPAPRIQPDSDDDSDEEDAMGYEPSFGHRDKGGGSSSNSPAGVLNQGKEGGSNGGNPPAQVNEGHAAKLEL
ncbi:hypothetical protein OIU77_007064 [Salix suchowensis]|uniref:Uncharacterized protein n=1 Tax=Salix suchowensis TaxID=1278906 RepID=A0ABQ9APY1_9ROSI|nr:hypothetical protein OIU77_007064 [Salix suchowensis]